MFHSLNRSSRFLWEALPAISTYFSGETVNLGSRGLFFEGGANEEWDAFLSQMQMRHALAYASEIIYIIASIETSYSSFRSVGRSETKGGMNGKLDIPRYVNAKVKSLSWPKRYPILMPIDSPSTPENILVYKMLLYLYGKLDPLLAPFATAEFNLANSHRAWIRHRFKMEPWASVKNRGSFELLRAATERRIARRQTGNESAYSCFLKLFDEWYSGYNVDINPVSENILRALLTFPSDDSFHDRIFEIWCLIETAQSLERIGTKKIEGPIPLYEAKSKAVYKFLYKDRVIELWFQRSLPADKAEWHYADFKKPLRGIPDIVCVCQDKYLLIDAKNRNVTSNTRPEETYKILGYFKNFNSLFPNGLAQGLLCFTSENGFSQKLNTESGGTVHLISASHDKESCTFAQKIDESLKDWLNKLL